MPHVSRKKLKEDALVSLQKRFSKSLSKLHSENQTSRFLNELLTDTERLMLGKRLAIIFLLSEGVSTYRIENVLGVSISTAVGMKHKYENGHYDYIKKAYKHKQSEEYWDDLNKILRLGMPPMGKSRWKWLYDLEKKHS